MKERKVVKWILGTLALVYFGVIPCVVVIGGIDCEPPDDTDLLLTEYDVPYDPKDNGWAMLSNVLAKAECICEGDWNKSRLTTAYHLAQDNLSWYVDPFNHERDVFCSDEDGYGMDKNVFYSNFTNKTRMCAYVDGLLATNAWFLAGIDAVLNAPSYAPPPPQSMSPFPLSELIRANQTLLLARVKVAIDRGDYDRAVECFCRCVRLATLLQVKCSDDFDSLLGMAMLDSDVCFLERIINENDIPHAFAEKLVAAFRDLPGLSDESRIHAIKRAYACRKAECSIDPVERCHPFFPSVPPLRRLTNYNVARYVFHANRTLAQIGDDMRNAINCLGVPPNCATGSQWSNTSVGVIALPLPNCLGHMEVRFNRFSVDRFKMFAEYRDRILAARQRLSDKLAGAAANELGASSRQYFPLVYTNGCFYTQDRKRLVFVGDEAKSFTARDDIEIGDDVYFDGVEEVSIPLNITNALSQWRMAIESPVHLRSIVIASNHPEIGVSGGCVYDRTSGELLNVLCGKKRIDVPREVVKTDAGPLMNLRDVKKLHFCGPLPKLLYVRKPCGTVAQCIQRWCEHPSWKRFKKIFQKKTPYRGILRKAPPDLVVTVSRENADERTREIVESGMWEGRPIRWKEP